MSVPQFARALETVPESQSMRRSRCVESIPAAPVAVPAPRAMALITEMRRVAGLDR